MQPTLETPRLRLRPFTLDDAPRVQALAGEWAVADTTLHIPHPYHDGAAEAWISLHAEHFEERAAAVFAITLRDGGALIGAIGLVIDLRHDHAELGYWLGVPYWGRGYCTEAAAEVLRFAFAELGLRRVFAHHFARNPASGSVLRKIGMRPEGRLRQHVKKWGLFEDLEQYGIVREEMKNRE